MATTNNDKSDFSSLIDVDKFYIDKESQSVDWVYFNPDSDAGGQFVYNSLSFEQIRQAAEQHKTAEDFFDNIGEVAKQTLLDIDSPGFQGARADFEAVTGYIKPCSIDTMKWLSDIAENRKTYYTISEQSARRAKEANSFRDYVPGSATSEYRAMVDEAMALGERQKARVDPMYHEKIDYYVDKYARKLAENLNEQNNIRARVPSVMIAGPSNFPVRKKEKQNMAMDRNMGEYQHIQGYLDKIRSTGMGGISADDINAVEKLQAKLDGLKESQETMKAVNAYYRMHKSLDGCPHLSEEVIEKLKVTMSRDWRQNAPPFPSYSLSNNNANIHATEQRLNDLKNRSEYVGWSFEGGRAEINEDINRLQLFFDEKPSEEQRRVLKSNAFKYAPSQNHAWQRQLTKNAIYSAGSIDFIKPDNGQTPYQLQPFSRKTTQDQSR